MEHGQQEVQPSFTLGRAWSRLLEDMSQSDTLQRSYGNHQRIGSQQEAQTPGGKGSQDKGESSRYPNHKRTTEPDKEYSVSFRITGSKPTGLPSVSTTCRHQQISDQESPFSTILGTFKEKTRVKREKKTSFNQRQKESDPML
ncbi:hypothetical protein O181_029284 [Austropuccinia psidii MF-1]|uniref:Uncharacterized protein n=1 Tax=Austropuccinia psidii MF-1 TaxID=1389203 RepID=A0A9Q3CQL3_9BASI|nr:hypothetical protein [Austropuccinia psidii MF-1]